MLRDIGIQRSKTLSKVGNRRPIISLIAPWPNSLITSCTKGSFRLKFSSMPRDASIVIELFPELVGVHKTSAATS